MSRAGQANEAGSMLRCLVAAHLAVHGLGGIPTSGLAQPADLALVRLDFETSDPTDDIRATFADGARAYISAKRQVSTGDPLKETVAGWVGQAESLRPGDLLVIAGEEFVGPTNNLEYVLRRHREGLPLETLEEKKAFTALHDLPPSAVREIVLDRARVVAVPPSSSNKPPDQSTFGVPRWDPRKSGVRALHPPRNEPSAGHHALKPLSRADP